MRFTLSILIGLLLASVNASVIAAQQECDTVLLQRTQTFIKTQSAFGMAWLNLVNKENYESVKADTAGSAYGGLFQGDFSGFYEKREALFTINKYHEESDDSRQDVRIQLPEGAVDAWRQCVLARIKQKSNEFEAWIDNIDASAVTLTLSWQPADGVGPLKIISKDLVGTTANSFANLSVLPQGTHKLTLARNPNFPIHGSVTGKFGKPAATRAIDFYVPKQTTPPDWVMFNKCGCDIHVPGSIVLSSGASYSNSEQCFNFQSLRAICRRIGNTEGELDNPLRRDCVVFNTTTCQAVGYVDCFRPGTPYDALCNQTQYP